MDSQCTLELSRSEFNTAVNQEYDPNNVRIWFTNFLNLFILYCANNFG